MMTDGPTTGITKWVIEAERRTTWSEEKLAPTAFIVVERLHCRDCREIVDRDCRETACRDCRDCRETIEEYITFSGPAVGPGSLISATRVCYALWPGVARKWYNMLVPSRSPAGL